MSAAGTATRGARGGGAALGPLVQLIGRSILGRRRTVGVAFLAAAPVGVAAIFAISGALGDPETVALDLYAAITLALVVPLVALVLGIAALGAAMDDGTIVYLLVRPVPRWTILVAAALVAALATAALTVPAALVSALLLLGTGSPGLVAGMVLATLLASILYAVAFVALSAFTSRALVIGLGYVLIWEGVVTSLLPGTRILSIREYALAVVTSLGGTNSGAAGGGVDLATALAMSAIVLAGAVMLGSWRLRRFEVTDSG